VPTAPHWCLHHIVSQLVLPGRIHNTVVYVYPNVRCLLRPAGTYNIQMWSQSPKVTIDHQSNIIVIKHNIKHYCSFLNDFIIIILSFDRIKSLFQVDILLLLLSLRAFMSLLETFRTNLDQHNNTCVDSDKQTDISSN